jgi:hypothetical protein
VLQSLVAEQLPKGRAVALPKEPCGVRANTEAFRHTRHIDAFAARTKPYPSRSKNLPKPKIGREVVATVNRRIRRYGNEVEHVFSMGRDVTAKSA